MKELLRKASPGWLRRVSQFISADILDRHAVKSYSQEGEDLILRRIFESQKVGFYVDIGAHHPKRFSNTNYFYKHGWRGINIDPNPDSEKLFDRYRPRDVNLLCGVSDKPGEMPYFMFNEPALNTFSKELVESRTPHAHYRVIATKNVRLERLDAILDRHLPPGTQIDFMSIDVEGYDLNVVHSNDWVKFRPKCVVVEALASTIDDLLQCDLHKYLASKGYVLFAKTYNSVFYMDGKSSR